MKAFMYHYIREGSSELPWFRYLHIDNFRKQLDLFQKEYYFLSQTEFLNALETNKPHSNAAILTFDDGLIDHYETAKELHKRGLWGIFYIPTGPYSNNKLLDVHRVHMLIGKYGGESILNKLKTLVLDNMLQEQYVNKFKDLTYSRQDNDSATKEVKQILNYYLRPDQKNKILDDLMLDLFPDEKDICRNYYLSPAHIKEMSEMGMIIGAHSVTHPVFSHLPSNIQQTEIYDCFEYLKNVCGALDTKTFCYPYGGDHSFNADTVQILNQENVLFSFSVEQRDIDVNDLINKRQSLPRYDCNQFAHGQASMGVENYLDL